MPPATSAPRPLPAPPPSASSPDRSNSRPSSILRACAVAIAVALTACACSGTRFLNTLSVRMGYDAQRDIPFDPASGLKLDVYAPSNAVKAPVVVFFYGGRWSAGDKETYFFVAKGLVSRGIVAVLPNYRLYPEVRFPTFVEDAAMATTWTHEHIADFGGDPDNIFVMGHSAGAHLAALLALDPDYMKNVGGDRDWIKGMIGLAGPYDFLPTREADVQDIFLTPTRYESSQPIDYVDRCDPPLLLMHGRDDSAVELKNTLSLSSAVRRTGGSVRTIVYRHLSHGRIVAAMMPFYRLRAGPLDQVDEFVHHPAITSPCTLAPPAPS